ncbi:MAG: hypothetical protein M0Z45_09680 [Actinomycetota bacterium]|nr:hypothetical protein [Actinomycetota bacterium]
MSVEDKVLVSEFSRSGIGFFEAQTVGKVPNLSDGGRFHDVPLVLRRDPIFGGQTRFVLGSKLQPEEVTDLTPIVNAPGFCPFCPDKIDAVTYPFPTEMVNEGKITRGKSIVVPNILSYSTYSAVGVYDRTKHFVDMKEMDSNLIGDLLTGMVDHAKAVREYDPDAKYSSINANYLPPSGSSLVHPHIQSSHDYLPLSSQGKLIDEMAQFKAETGRGLLEALIEAERDLRVRYVGDWGAVSILTPFAPVGFREVWIVSKMKGDIVDLTEAQVGDFARALAFVIDGYVKLNLQSFNFAMTGSGDAEVVDGNVLLRIVARSNPTATYRSDVTYFERLYNESMIDVTPEETASFLRG